MSTVCVRRLHGFTLIELLVVVLLITIVMAIVSVNLDPNRDTNVRDEAQRLALLLQTAQQEAILQGIILAVVFEPQGYSFLMLNNSREFVHIQSEEILRARPMPVGVKISSVEIEGSPATENPRLLLLPSGELPSFTVTLSLNKIRWQVQGTLAGEISAQVEPVSSSGKKETHKSMFSDTPGNTNINAAK